MNSARVEDLIAAHGVYSGDETVLKKMLTPGTDEAAIAERL